MRSARGVKDVECISVIPYRFGVSGDVHSEVGDDGEEGGDIEARMWWAIVSFGEEGSPEYLVRER